MVLYEQCSVPTTYCSNDPNSPNTFTYGDATCGVDLESLRNILGEGPGRFAPTEQELKIQEHFDSLSTEEHECVEALLDNWDCKFPGEPLPDPTRRPRPSLNLQQICPISPKIRVDYAVAIATTSHHSQATRIVALISFMLEVHEDASGEEFSGTRESVSNSQSRALDPQSMEQHTLRVLNFIHN